MMKSALSRAQTLSAPNPFALVCSVAPEGKTNLVAVSWWTYLANRPPMLGFALSAGKYTSKLLAENPMFALCLAGDQIKDAAFGCGAVSGANCDKANKLRIALVDLPGVPVQVPNACRAVLAGRVIEAHPVGDHIFHVAQIDSVFEDVTVAALYAVVGYRRLATVMS